MNDGLATGQLLVSDVSGTSAQFTSISGTITAALGTISNAELADSAASGTKVSTEYAPFYGGSPIIGNWAIMTGSGTANTFSVFPKPFAASPGFILVGALASGVGQMLFPASVSAGSFLPSGGAAVAITYFAAGSGRV